MSQSRRCRQLVLTVGLATAVAGCSSVRRAVGWGRIPPYHQPGGFSATYHEALFGPRAATPAPLPAEEAPKSDGDAQAPAANGPDGGVFVPSSVPLRRERSTGASQSSVTPQRRRLTLPFSQARQLQRQ